MPTFRMFRKRRVNIPSKKSPGGVFRSHVLIWYYRLPLYYLLHIKDLIAYCLHYYMKISLHLYSALQIFATSNVRKFLICKFRDFFETSHYNQISQFLTIISLVNEAICQFISHYLTNRSKGAIVNIISCQDTCCMSRYLLYVFLSIFLSIFNISVCKPKDVSL